MPEGIHRHSVRIPEGFYRDSIRIPSGDSIRIPSGASRAAVRIQGFCRDSIRI